MRLLIAQLVGVACAAENIYQLVLHQFFDIGTGGFQILARIKLLGVLGEELANGAGHSQC